MQQHEFNLTFLSSYLVRYILFIYPTCSVTHIEPIQLQSVIFIEHLVQCRLLGVTNKTLPPCLLFCIAVLFEDMATCPGYYVIINLQIFCRSELLILSFTLPLNGVKLLYGELLQYSLFGD